MGKSNTHKIIVKMKHLLVLLNSVILITGVAVRDHSLTKRQASDFLRHKRSAQDHEIRYENGLIYNEQWVPKSCKLIIFDNSFKLSSNFQGIYRITNSIWNRVRTFKFSTSFSNLKF